MSREKTVFTDVSFAGALTGRGSVRVEPGWLAVRRGVRFYALIILLPTLVLVGIVLALMLVYRSPALQGVGVVGAIVALVLLAAVFAVRAFLAVIWGPEPLRPVITSQGYDVLPAGRGAQGQPTELRFTSRQPRRNLEEFTLRFERPDDAQRCYEVFTAEEVPQSAEG